MYIVKSWNVIVQMTKFWLYILAPAEENEAARCVSVTVLKTYFLINRVPTNQIGIICKIDLFFIFQYFDRTSQAEFADKVLNMDNII